MLVFSLNFPAPALAGAGLFARSDTPDARPVRFIEDLEAALHGPDK
jgi:hypothetical protein